MMRFKQNGVAMAVALLAAMAAQGAAAQTSGEASDGTQTLPATTVRASADASAQGLSPAYAGGQVARGGRAGILGTRDNMDTPFSITAYTNELIQDRQARSVGDVLQNDPTVRMARGFGNFQESYFIRGFVLSSDDVAYNGLYNLLPRQYIATELFERVELLRGSSAFLNGANPGDSGIGGAINLLPKRAPNEPLNRVTLSLDGHGSQGTLSADVARRFGPDQGTGVRVNAAVRDGGTGVDDENVNLGLLSVGLDWRGRHVRLSGDVGYQDHKLRRTRTNVTPGGSVTAIPSAPDNESNWAQDWSYSNERDLFGTFRGEVDLAADVTAWLAYGVRRSQEANSLANITLQNATTGAATTSRFDNTREDHVDTGEIGVRANWKTGSIGHELVVSYSSFQLRKNAAYSIAGAINTNLYSPSQATLPALTTVNNELSDPGRTGTTDFDSVAVGDTLSMLDGRLLLTAGARRQQLQTKSLRYQTRNLSTNARGTSGTDSSYDKSRTSPSLALVFKATPQWSVYGNYVEALTQGQTASGTPVYANQGAQLAPYVSKQKEIGVKHDGGKLGGGLSFFSTTKPRGVRSASNEFVAEGEDRHQGLELTAHGQLLRGLRVLGGATWLDAEQRSTGSATTDGKRVIGVARFQSTLGAEWDVPGVRGLALDGRLVYTGSRYANATNTLKVGGWTRVDVGARYTTDIQGRVLTLRARVDNLADRDYWASVGGYPGSGYLVAGAPRTLGVSASVDF